MIINLTLGHILLLILPLGISAFLLWFLFVKLKWNEKIFGIAFIPGAILWLFLWSSCTLDLVVVKSDLSVDRYMVFFGAEYEATDGQKIEVRRTRSEYGVRYDVFIVNTSDVTLAQETIAYGDSPFAFLSSGPDIIPPHRTLMDGSVPDDFPFDVPPGSVSVQKGIKGDSRDWLRAASEEEIQNAPETQFGLVPLP